MTVPVKEVVGLSYVYGVLEGVSNRLSNGWGLNLISATVQTEDVVIVVCVGATVSVCVLVDPKLIT